jgi:glycosyltransferase involved in cell wall biosynthesis
MKFSIITVCYNSVDTIDKTIMSVLAQSFQDFEYIIIDGASTDGTLEIIKKYAEQFPDKISYISEKDSGIYDAMNKGISRAKGELIGLLNSNDYYEENALEIVSKEYSGEKYQILYGIQRNIDETGEGKSIRFIHHEKLCDDMITHPTCFVTKCVYSDYGVYDLTYKSASDYDFMLRIKSLHPDVKFYPIYKVLTNFTLGGISSSVIGKIETHEIKYKYHIITKPKLLLWNAATFLKKMIQG